MIELKKVFYLKPTPWSRSGMVTRGGKARAFLQKNTREAENEIRFALRQCVVDEGRFPPGIPLSLSVTFFLEKPKSAGKKVYYPVKRPDLDNYVKLVLDALNNYAVPDDSQIVNIRAFKRFDSPPRIDLCVSIITEV